MAEDLYSSLPDEMLARLLFTEDKKAYEIIYLRYWRPLYATAVWKTNDVKVAEELVQELFMQLWENRQVRLINNLEAYLKTAIKYKIISFVKDRIAAPKIQIADMPEQRSDSRADAEMGIQELSNALQEALRLLPEKTSMIFQMSRFEQRSNAEIADHLGLTERTIEYHISQSLRLLRLHLKDYFPISTLVLTGCLW